jgi:hypothetical protein
MRDFFGYLWITWNNYIYLMQFVSNLGFPDIVTICLIVII